VPNFNATFQLIFGQTLPDAALFGKTFLIVSSASEDVRHLENIELPELRRIGLRIQRAPRGA